MTIKQRSELLGHDIDKGLILIGEAFIKAKENGYGDCPRRAFLNVSETGLERFLANVI
jgi:hypothetical protein